MIDFLALSQKPIVGEFELFGPAKTLVMICGLKNEIKLMKKSNV